MARGFPRLSAQVDLRAPSLAEMANLPTEPHHGIFELLHIHDAICHGLTNKKPCAALKTINWKKTLLRRSTYKHHLGLKIIKSKCFEAYLELVRILSVVKLQTRRTKSYKQFKRGNWGFQTHFKRYGLLDRDRTLLLTKGLRASLGLGICWMEYQ
jgi:hypothetical protein